jgi:hypothetical protein
MSECAGVQTQSGRNRRKADVRIKYALKFRTGEIGSAAWAKAGRSDRRDTVGLY